MKKILFSLHFITATLLAQKVTYNYSQEFETINKYSNLGFYRFNANEYAELYYTSEGHMTFHVFDSIFSTVKKLVDIPLPEDSKKYTYEHFSSINSKFYWFYSTWERKTKMERLFALPFDKTSLKFNAKEIKLLEAGRMVPYWKYGFHTSKDSSKLLVTYTLKQRKKNDKINKNTIGFNLFDNNMNKLYAAEIQMPYAEYDMNNLGYTVDSKGNIYMLIKAMIYKEPESLLRSNTGDYRYELLRVDKQTNTLQCIQINLENKFTKSVILSEDLTGNIVIAGYYSDKKNTDGSNGAYLSRLEYDENNALKNLRTTRYEFPLEVLKKKKYDRIDRLIDKHDKNEDTAIFNLSLNNVIFNKDGSILLVGEENSSIFYTYQVGDRTHTGITYNYDDILALKIDKGGKIQWCNKIRKKQSSGFTPGFSSYFLHEYNGNFYLFYLDNIKNINLSLTETEVYDLSPKGIYLAMVKIDADGKMIKTSILESDEGMPIRPSDFTSVNEHFIVERIRADKKESKIFRLEFN